MSKQQKEEKMAEVEGKSLQEPAGDAPVQTTFEEEHLIYIGPTLPIGLSRYATFRGGKPAYLLDYLKSVPTADALFIPVAELSSSLKELSVLGSPLKTAYEVVQATLKGGA
ncbi:hypothetical protein [Paenibacillus chitinolyticus]|uniref:hypothetical protein n=1 Tax=Paenibacillus chitinolyticus TaxID=79263 RepID=UPI00295F5704|nr:hypothetical protein [Paenibacillus chitinolyticus]